MVMETRPERANPHKRTIDAEIVQVNVPSDASVTEYDRRNLALYAALLEADDAGREWQDVVANLMQLDAALPEAEACWRSHLDRAHWIIGEGMADAIVAFGLYRDQHEQN
jgi:hypothetical protein